MAKGILCEMKQISESEAYDVLRKQAMNERKEWWMLPPRSLSCINCCKRPVQEVPKIMIHLLKEVGRGKRGARDLTYEEALQAAASILGAQATPAQIGAFSSLNASRWKAWKNGSIREGQS